MSPVSIIQSKLRNGSIPTWISLLNDKTITYKRVNGLPYKTINGHMGEGRLPFFYSTPMLLIRGV